MTDKSIYERIMNRQTDPEKGLLKGADQFASPSQDARNGNKKNAAPAGRLVGLEAKSQDDNGNVHTEIADGGADTMRTRSYSKILLMGVSLLVVLAVGAVAGVVVKSGGINLPEFAQATDKPTKVAQAETTGTKKAGNVTEQPHTVFDDHIAKSGLKACKDVFPFLGAAATSGAAFSASSSWSQVEPSSHSVQSIVGMTFDTDVLKGNGASVVYSAPVAGKCEGLYVRVVPVAQDCKSFQSTLPKDSKLAADLGGTPLMTLPSGLQTMLVPSAGNGCVVITTTRAAG